ncbi:dethiobiotin synthase [Aliidiomarina minuta]|uniref:ATP-dependent dethiobiotin synthetase BioD n=1 Tax=Aliidiomarina minuta TaxID=880057 RepID=A0A432W6G1_9GAMM|nr:dethiobiotin synthase [Aliidiomarina minuta]RUO25663.1 dethiobiotin synthase [Aliidiomarina minuta]
MTKCVFVTGTDTDSGKSMAAALILREFSLTGQKTIAFKPVASGCAPYNADALQLMAECSVKQPYAEVNPFAFEPAIAPHIAAAEAGVEVTKDGLWQQWRKLQGYHADFILTEGAGGWQLPLSESFQMPEFVQQAQMPVILVVGMKLGCLNHALLSLQAMRAQGIPVIGWIANQLTEQPMPYWQQNLEYLRQNSGCPYLGSLGYIRDYPAARLEASLRERLFTAIANSSDLL